MGRKDRHTSREDRDSSQGGSKKRIDWPSYDKALKNRGSITFWFSEEAIKGWHPPHGGRRGGQRDYSDTAIETVLCVRLLYKQALRQTEGFVESLLELMNLDLKVPDHTTVSRRLKKLDVQPLARAEDGPIEVIVDSTGLKIYGKVEWDAAKHGQTRRRWRKLHLIINKATLEILGHTLTTDDVGDVPEAPTLLDQVDEDVDELMGDGAYDSQNVYDAANASCSGGAARVIVPPRKNATLSSAAAEEQTQRDRHLLVIAAIGRQGWEEYVDYGQRLRVENAMFRCKTIIGRKMRARDLPAQRTETAVGCKILNRMARLGLPRTRAVA